MRAQFKVARLSLRAGRARLHAPSIWFGIGSTEFMSSEGIVGFLEVRVVFCVCVVWSIAVCERFLAFTVYL